MHNPDSLKVVEILKQNDRQTIYLVEDTDGKKYLKREISGDKREIYKALQKINHPNIPKIFYIALTDYTTVVEEYIDGTPLSDWTEKDKKLNRKQIYSIARQILSALEKLHKESIIHRDIKPDNILLDDTNHAWLIDYDIARIYRKEIRKDTESMGTFGYAPIEQYGMMPTDFKTDIYAFGKTIKSLLDYSGIKCGLNKVADKCTRLDPAQRYSSVNAVKKAVLLSAWKKAMFYGVALAVILIIGLRAMYIENDTLDVAEQVILPKTEISKPEQEKESKADDSKTTKSAKNLPSNEADKKEYKPIEETYNFEGEFANFEPGQIENEYYNYSNFPSVSIFSTDTPYTHLLFLEDIRKQGKIKLGKEENIIDADITLENGVLSVSLNDNKGNAFNKQFSFNNQYEYQKAYTSNLRKNADIICYDFDSDSCKELLIGLNECVLGVNNSSIYNRLNYCIAWCVKYEENVGFTLCKGDMFSKEQPFSINSYTNKLNVMWENASDITGYYLKGTEIIPSY